MSLEFTSKLPQFNLKMREVKQRKVYGFEDFRLDADHLLISRGDSQISLTPKVVETLLALVERPGEIVTKEEMMQRLWPDSIVEEGNLFQNLHVLRKALGTAKDGSPFIETLRRRGFRFSAEVVENPDSKQLVNRPALVERSDNVYTVADWKRENTTSADRRLGSYRYVWAMAAAVAVIIISGVAASGVLSGRAASSDALSSRAEMSMTAITNGRDVNDAAISPDGLSLAYHEVNGDLSRLVVQQIGNSSVTEIIPPTAIVIGPKTFSPDGKTVYFSAIEKGASSTTIYSVPIMGGPLAKLVDGLEGFFTIAVSPDGARLGFIRRTVDGFAINLFHIESRSETTILRAEKGESIWGGLAWSNDGSSIAYGRIDHSAATQPRCSIAVVDAASGATKPLSPEKWDGCGRMAWTTDDEGLYFIGTRQNESLSTRRDQLFYLTVDTGEARRITTDGNRHQVSSLGLTQKNEVVVVPFNRSSQLWTMNSNGDAATARQITTGTADGRPGIAPLPDGRIAFIARTGENLNVWTVAGDGSDLRQLTSKPQATEELRASPDGMHLYFSAITDGKPRLFRCDADGSNLRTAVTDPSFDVDSSISPDGRWIVYNSAVVDNDTVNRTLRMASTEGGEPIQLTDSFAQAPHFSPDGRFVSYVAENNSLRVISIPDGRRIATFTVSGNPFLNPGARWTPDGSSMLYIVRQNGASNIWRQPLDGSPASALTNFTSGEIYNFAFSAESKNLILARGYPTKNAVLIK